MLYCRIEIWPGGDRSRARTLGEATIANVGGSLDRGDYDCKIMKSPEYATRPGVWKRASIQNFPRQRLGPWELLCALLASAVGKRFSSSGAVVAELEPGTLEAVECEALRLPVEGRPEPLYLGSQNVDDGKPGSAP